ncbi:hypothetical protein [Zobellella endophytica]|uniref:hypothetical protein n=1 Tax=Zobellella endophytica TaxID=2116700 RepID=UPI0011B235CD|nr:hypothetical protein [Zobellella endophytica]
MAPFFLFCRSIRTKAVKVHVSGRQKGAGGDAKADRQRGAGQGAGVTFVPAVNSGSSALKDSKGYAQPAHALRPVGLPHLSTISVDKVVDWLDKTGAKPVVAGITDKSAKKSPKAKVLKIKKLKKAIRNFRSVFERQRPA